MKCHGMNRIKTAAPAGYAPSATISLRLHGSMHWSTGTNWSLWTGTATASHRTSAESRRPDMAALDETAQHYAQPLSLGKPDPHSDVFWRISLSGIHLGTRVTGLRSLQAAVRNLGALHLPDSSASLMLAMPSARWVLNCGRANILADRGLWSRAAARDASTALSNLDGSLPIVLVFEELCCAARGSINARSV
jgi:hypothetical protein